MHGSHWGLQVKTSYIIVVIDSTNPKHCQSRTLIFWEMKHWFPTLTIIPSLLPSLLSSSLLTNLLGKDFFQNTLVLITFGFVLILHTTLICPMFLQGMIKRTPDAPIISSITLPKGWRNAIKQQMHSMYSYSSCFSSIHIRCTTRCIVHYSLRS